MTSRRTNLARLSLAALPLALLGACATPRAPLQVNVASVERIDSAPMELRFVARLRVRNPNDMALEFSGTTAELSLSGSGKVIGGGVSDTRGTVPRLGEAIVELPITVDALGDVRQAIGLYGAANRKLDVALRGRLVGGGDALRFEWRGELAMAPATGS